MGAVVTAEQFAHQRGFRRPIREKLAQRAIKRPFRSIFRSLGELVRARTHIGPRRANFFAHRTSPRGEVETNDTSAAADAGQRETTITTARP